MRKNSSKKKIEENHLSFIKQNKVIITTKKPLKTKITQKKNTKPNHNKKQKQKTKKKKKKENERE